MKIFRVFTSLFLIISLITPGLSFAEIDWKARVTITPQSKPIDIAITADGKHTFILGEGGKLYIYTSAGRLHDTIEVSEDMNKIAVDGNGARIFLSNDKKNTVHELILDYVVAMDYKGSAFLGNSEAPVVLAVFSDFQ